MNINNQTFNISLSEYSGEVCLVLYHSPCNLNCNWCFNKRNLTHTLLDYETAIMNIKDNREFITSVCLTGGEPLLSPDFYRICEYVNDDGLKLKVNTSGTIAPSEEFHADYMNISFKGNYSDYLRYGYKNTKETLEKTLNIYTCSGMSDKVEWSVVYHKLIIDLNTTYDFMQGLDCKPNYFTLTQLQVGECNDNIINDFTPPSRDTLIEKSRLFKETPTDHLLIETKEYGREIII